MKIKSLFLLLFGFLSCCTINADNKIQKFFNLTADEVRIDSLLPYFTYSVPLGQNWTDSVYTVKIIYPEFLKMSNADSARYDKITDKEPPEMPEIETNTVVERKKGFLEISFVPLVMRDKKYMKLVSFMLQIESTARPYPAQVKGTGTRATSASERYAEHSILAEGTWAKIRVPSTGIYQITESLIKKAGFSNLDKVKIYGYGGALQNETLTAADLIEYDDLKEVATCTVDGKRLFHAQGPVSWNTNTATKRTRNPYSDYGYYLITENDDEPLTVDSTTFVDSFYPSADDYHAIHEIDNYAWYQGGRNLFEDSPVNLGSSKSYTIDLPSGAADYGVLSIGTTAGLASSVQISVNDSVVGTQNITLGSYDNGNETESTYRIYNFKASNTVTITPTSGGPVRLDYISLYENNPKPRPTLAGKSYDAPEYVYNITNQDHHADGPVDMVIIIPTSGKLLAQAERIKELHEQKDSMTVRIVPADELFNEFSSATPDANAYRRYLKMLYDRAETEDEMPSYLFLFGDCVWDNRMNTTDCKNLDPDDFLLCLESENSFSSTDCYVDDGFFTNLDDGEGGTPKTDKGDIAVGRFPARDADQAQILVDKTINYVKNENAGSWQNIIMCMGDDGNENQHMKDAEEMASLIESINPSLYVKRVMWDSYNRVTTSTGNSYPDVSKLIKEQQNNGALIMNYNGHGRADQISHEIVLTLSDFEQFTNKNLPLWITASCDIMPFDMQEDNIGEEALLNANGGAVAFYGTARTVYVDRNRYINKAFLNALLTPSDDGKYITLGEAQRIAKNNLITTATDVTLNKLQYALLGDPALVLNIPKQSAVIDSINGVAVASASDLPSLKAGSKVTLKGHINNDDSIIDTSFNGTATIVVRDSKNEVVCRLNDTSSDGASTAFTYYDRINTIYSGSNNVTDGEFSLSFAVPMDISYSNESGLINVFAVNTETYETVNGYNEDFTVGGTEKVNNDSIGPSIYCYLNSPSFTNGDNVNPTPYFVAEVTDNDGINAAGSGIGHDMMLIIDGDANMTYNLNDNFTFDFGSYTKGSTFYSIPELSLGAHTLKFRAWDILNNCSTAELSFNIVNALKPDYISISCSSNPATTNTTFIINHDRAGSDIDIQIDVFDISGRPLWSHEENGTASSSSYTVDWDLKGNNGEQLETGVYIYRVRISSDGSQAVSKAQKLVIINR
ncbi:MAG: type IX secretion system sortase PorU [Prevotella sp.]|nr:type IX secretion system sortase PorU [Prevotella sp.]